MSALGVDDERALLDEATSRQLAQAISEARGREVAGLVTRSHTGKSGLLLAPSLEVEPGVAEVPGWWLERARRWAAREQVEIVAFVHSQATSVDPSPEDLHGMETTGLPWLIVRRVDGVLQHRLYGGG